jgi:hypothetical protein
MLAMGFFLAFMMLGSVAYLRAQAEQQAMQQQRA